MTTSQGTLSTQGYLALPATLVRGSLPSELLPRLRDLQESFADLVKDEFMADGGTYRFRRYSRFRLEGDQLAPLEGHSILQSREENPLNGGVVRTFAPLQASVANHPLLGALIWHDAGVAKECWPELFEKAVQVGVHQVRIVTRVGESGLPTPEGIHLDGESFTFQHFIRRENARGGEFRAYDQSKRLVFSWLQEESLDSVAFRGTTWHSATPITTNPDAQEGHRDIFLIDFDPLP